MNVENSAIIQNKNNNVYGVICVICVCSKYVQKLKSIFFALNSVFIFEFWNFSFHIL